MQAEDVRRELERRGIRASRALGQHFLIDERVAHRQVEFASIHSDDVVFEVGPGLGVLTRILAERSRRVIVVETDRRLADALTYARGNVEVITGDALTVGWPAFDVMVSNLPYSISSPITFRLLDHEFDRAVLMFQREFADRMVAKPNSKDYSRLTVGVFHRSRCEIIERVPKTAFYPIPKVDSAIVMLVPRPPPYRVLDEGVFHSAVDACFAHRRKTIANALDLAWRNFTGERDTWRQFCRSLPFATRRAETMSPEDFAKLANAIARAKG